MYSSYLFFFNLFGNKKNSYLLLKTILNPKINVNIIIGVSAIVSAIAQLIPGQGMKNVHGMINASTIKNVAKYFDVLYRLTPTIRIAIEANVKNEIDEIKWIPPALLGNIPTHISEIAANMKIIAPEALSFVSGKMLRRKIPKMIVSNPVIMRP